MIIQLIVLLVFVFAGLTFFMVKILSQNTQAAVGRLDSVYKDLLEKQKELNAKIEETEKEYHQKKEEAEKICEKLKAEATEEMRLKRDELMKQAKTQADEIQDRAREGTQEHFKKTEREAKSKAFDYMQELFISALEERTSAAFHNLLVDDFIEKAQNFDLTKISPDIDTVTVKTPFPLNDQQQAKIKSMIALKVNRSFKIEEIHDKKLIAGILMHFGTLLLDGTIANAVREANEKMKEKIQFE